MQEEKDPADSSDENLFDRMANLDNLPAGKKFQRSGNNIILTGTCAGIAEYFKADAALIRLAAFFTLLIGGWGAVAYLVAASLLPIDRNPAALSPEIKKLQQRENFRTLLGGLLMTAGIHFALVYIGLRSSENFFILPDGLIFSLAGISIGVLILINVFKISDESGSGEEKSFARSVKDRRILGVCGGLGSYLGIDASSLRIIFLLASLLTLGLFAIVYFILGFSVPSEMERKIE